MTRVYYILSNGTRVESYAEAVASGLSYLAKYETIETERAGACDGSLTERAKKILERKSATN